MADWNLPTLASIYTDFLTYLKGRDDDSITLGKTTITNPVVGTVRYERTTNTFQEWSGTAWINLVIALASGGVGSSTPAGARAALGIGTMGTQDANNVAITGGSITGLNSLGVNGAASVGSLAVVGHATANTLAVALDENIGRNLGVVGNVTSGSLNVNGASVLNTLTVNGATALNTLNVAGAAATGPLTVNGSETVNGNIAATGAVTANAHLHGVTGIYAGNPAVLLTVGSGHLDSTKISGLIPVANLGSGIANIDKVLRGNGTWGDASVLKSIQYLEGNKSLNQGTFLDFPLTTPVTDYTKCVINILRLLATGGVALVNSIRLINNSTLRMTFTEAGDSLVLIQAQILEHKVIG